MRLLIQRVDRAEVKVADMRIAAIDVGLLILAAIAPDDTLQAVNKLAYKAAHLRIFSDDNGRFAHSLLDVSGSALVVSQFTLFADTRKGRRPSFSGSAAPDFAKSMIDQFVNALRQQGVSRVLEGEFGASMDVELVNHGPVTIWLDSTDFLE